MSMYIILPREGTDINGFINDMSLSKWNSIKKALTNKKIILAIPRFKLEYGIKELKNSLSELGMGEAFQENADLSGIGYNLYISNMLHKAVIEVNEEGSEAAAATVGEITFTSVIEPDYESFTADRPFMFIINDDESDTILFMGKVLGVGEQ